MVKTGLLFVFGECGHDVSETEFNDWYDNEHAPARLTVPGFTNAVRYKATDSNTPSWLAIYDLNSPSVASSEPYKALAAQASDRERNLIPRLATLDRRIYESYSVKVNPLENPPNIFPGKFILLVTMLVKPELEEEFNRWYEEEHIPEVAKIPGWHRGRCYKLVSHVELAKETNDRPMHNYLAIHDWNHDTYLNMPEFTATPWSTEILPEQVTEINLRRFAIYKDIQKPE